MANQTIYNLGFQPGTTNKELVATYTLTFNIYTDYLFWNRGSYNSVDTPARSLYINNKQNNNLVTVNADNGQYVRDVPPYGEAILPIGERMMVSIACNGGNVPVEFRNTAAAERIFQRTDTASSIAQFSGTLGTTFGDLVTIDRIGRIQVADATPFTANNTTTDFQADTAWPANPASVTFSANHYAIQDSAGRLCVMDNGGAAQLQSWFSNNVGANVAANHSIAGACIPQPISEGPGAFYTAYQNQNFAALINKTTGAVLAGQTPPYGTGYLMVFPKANGVTLDYWVVANPAGNFLIANYVNNAFVSSATCTLGAGGFYDSSNDTINAVAFGTSNILVAFYNSAGNNFTVAVIDPLLNGAAISSLSTTANANTGFKNKNWIDWAISPVSGYAFLPFRSIATGNAHLVTVSPANVITNNNLGSAGSTVFGALTDDGGYIVCWHNGGTTLQVRKFDSSGTLAVTTSFTLGAGTWNGMWKMPTDSDSWVFPILFNNAGLRAIVIDGSANALIPVASSVAVGAGAAAGFPVYAVERCYATITIGTQPVAVQNDLAKSVFGVDRGNGAILIQGIASINQNFPGSNTFNQNAATVVGNRGIVVNSTAQLNGLT